ncbi:Low molecular weight phosphotyrosine protein phosphatase [Trichoplax sp. H2]|nr:Low molecular weight phosphotyrosine protein phosphatase [Trichoplax sp. H2]|eukprot:RDD41828.1 Low molecular weight phosphotyrosine protein phosphatase [Trichoplax sp. H2]
MAFTGLNFLKRKKKKSPKYSVMFVCAVNIQRSPMAEAIFYHLVEQRSELNKWDIASSGVSSEATHQQPVSPCTITVLEDNHIKPRLHPSRKLCHDDFKHYRYILCMDEDNLRLAKEKLPHGCKAKVELLGNYDPKGERIVVDPIFDCNDWNAFDPNNPAIIINPRLGNLSDYEHVFQQCWRSCNTFLDFVTGQKA